MGREHFAEPVAFRLIHRPGHSCPRESEPIGLVSQLASLQQVTGAALRWKVKTEVISDLHMQDLALLCLYSHT